MVCTLLDHRNDAMKCSKLGSEVDLLNLFGLIFTVLNFCVESSHMNACLNYVSFNMFLGTKERQHFFFWGGGGGITTPSPFPVS